MKLPVAPTWGAIRSASCSPPGWLSAIARIAIKSAAPGRPGGHQQRPGDYCRIYDQEGNLLAEAEVLLMNVPEETVQSTSLEALGWRIYSDEELKV
jgi:hypothetical protein